MAPSSNKYFSASLEKGLKILSLFSDQAPRLTQTEISSVLGLNTTSVFRFVNTLVRLGYLDKDDKTKELRLGMKSLALGTNILRATNRLDFIKKVVDRVHDDHNVTIDVGFAMDDNMVRVYRREAEETLIYRLPAVAEKSLHNTSVGKSFLSTLPEDELKLRIEKMELRPKTMRTITDKDRLLAEVDLTRRRGYALCDGEYLPGLVTIGAPLYDRSAGRGVGAVSFDFSTMEHAVAEVEEKYAGLIVELGHILSEILRGEDLEK